MRRGLSLKAPWLPSPNGGALGCSPPYSLLKHRWFVGTEADLLQHGGAKIGIWDRAKCCFTGELCVVTREMAQGGCTYPVSHHDWPP